MKALANDLDELPPREKASWRAFHGPILGEAYGRLEAESRAYAETLRGIGVIRAADVGDVVYEIMDEARRRLPDIAREEVE